MNGKDPVPGGSCFWVRFDWGEFPMVGILSNGVLDSGSYAAWGLIVTVHGGVE